MDLLETKHQCNIPQDINLVKAWRLYKRYMGVGQQEKPPISCETENRNKIELNK